MTCEAARRMSAWVIELSCACCLSCASAAPSAQAPETRPAASPSSEPAAASAPITPAAAPAAVPVESEGFTEAMTLLRPSVAAPSLVALELAPQDASAYAAAAVAYAATDVPVMTLLWGMTYQAMGGGKDEAAVAQALQKVLSERVTVQADPHSDRVDYNVRLAPGQMPVRQDANGSVEAPLAHAFEGLFSPSLVGFRPPWSIEEFYDALSSWVGIVSTRGTPFDSVLELHGWLVTLAKAGHLEAYCYRLLGSAFPLELKAYQASHAREFRALSAYLEASALKPTRAAAPDMLVRLK